MGAPSPGLSHLSSVIIEQNPTCYIDGAGCPYTPFNLLSQLSSYLRLLARFRTRDISHPFPFVFSPLHFTVLLALSQPLCSPTAL